MPPNSFNCLKDIHLFMLYHLLNACIRGTIHSSSATTIAKNTQKSLKTPHCPSKFLLTDKRYKQARNQRVVANVQPYSSILRANSSMMEPNINKKLTKIPFKSENCLTFCPIGQHVNKNNCVVRGGALTPAINSVSEITFLFILKIHVLIFVKCECEIGSTVKTGPYF